MKKLNFTLTLLIICMSSFGQEFKTSLKSATIYEASIYTWQTNCAVITDKGLLVHANDPFEVTDLNLDKTVLNHDFEGGGGQTWIDANGRYVGNYSQNTARLETGWVDAMHVYDLRSNKIYTNHLKPGYWNKGVFHPQKDQVLVNEYDVVAGSTRILLYDFVNQKEVKTFFTSTKFSTVVMALAFSKDGSKIYAGIGPNGYISYINVYDTETGNVLKKIDFKYSLDKIFVSDEYIYCSGEDGNTGGSFTSRINSDTYQVETWDHFRMGNMHPSGKFCFGVEYQSNILSQYDLTTGKKTDLFNVSTLGGFDFAYVSGFSPDGKYFFISRERKNDTPDYNKAIVVFKNEMMDEGDHIFEPVVDLMIEELPTVYNYISTKPKFSIDFEAKPEVKEEQTKSGGLKLTVKQSPSSAIVYMVMVGEISSKIKEDKYVKTAESMADKFVTNLEATDPVKKEITLDGYRGTEYTFTKKAVFYRYVSLCIAGYSYQIIYLNSAKDGKTGDDFFNSFTTR